ncbi:hypothetical protein COLO4_06725 [Corchorus olitorius]|uniref:Uncharacterized protein n=1 Tax=Corchorus olitorius TaxID=93759 RepID=A0A1R3KM59_9ROSI|nr:hypothetical protein COLO4_06725 [Corchorus olitorius]
MVRLKLPKTKGDRFLPAEEKPKNKKRIYAEADGFNAKNSDSTVKKKKKKVSANYEQKNHDSGKLGHQENHNPTMDGLIDHTSVSINENEEFNLEDFVNALIGQMKEMDNKGEKYIFEELIYPQEIHPNSILLDQPMIFKSCKSIQAPNGMNRL